MYSIRDECEAGMPRLIDSKQLGVEEMQSDRQGESDDTKALLSPRLEANEILRPEINQPIEPGRFLWDLGRLLMRIGVAFVVPAMLIKPIPEIAKAYLSRRSTIGILLLFVLGLVVAFIGRMCYKHGKKLAAAFHAKRILRDARPPVLYLRSFKDDKLAAHSASMALINQLLGPATVEEQLAKAMGELGPFLAIGKPKEELPELGAARIYVSNAEWQARVGDLMGRAALVVLRVGDTAGFWWEVERALRSLKPEQLLFLLPIFGRKKYERFTKQMNVHLPRPLPGFDEYKHKAGLGLTGFAKVLYFENDWTPHLLAFRGPWFVAGHGLWAALGSLVLPFAQYLTMDEPLVSVFKNTLNPVLEALHLKWQTPPRSPRKYYVEIVVLIVALFAAYNLASNKMVKDANKHYAQGDMLSRNDDIAGAIAEYRQAERFDPDGYAAHRKLGAVFVRKGDWDQAIGELTESVRLEPNIPETHFLFGYALSMKGKGDEAMVEYRNALRLDRNFTNAHLGLGALLLGKRDWVGAVAEFREAVRLNPSFATGHFYLGLALELNGEQKEALAQYSIATTLAPENSVFGEYYERLSRELP